MPELREVIVAIATGDTRQVRSLLDSAPGLATARIARADEFLVAERLAQVYEGDTALHAAAFSHDADLARDLIARNADVRARNRRGAEPLHSATSGGPGSLLWDPSRQRRTIEVLVEMGADPNARAMGGVTPLHRAVRNRCAEAVAELLRCGADPRATNSHGSTPSDLARVPTGRPGAGSAEAKDQQRLIIDLLDGALA